MKKILIFPFILLFAGLLFPQGGGIKIGFINSERLRQEYDEAAAVFTQLSAEQKKYLEEYNQIIAELDSVKELYEREKYTMSDRRKEDVQNYIQQLEKQKREFLYDRFGPQAQLYQNEKQLLDPILKKILDSIREIGIEENYDYIFDIANGEMHIVYAKEKYDLTDRVLEKLLRK